MRKASVDNTKKVSTLSQSRKDVLDKLEKLRLHRIEVAKQGIVNHMDSVRFGGLQYSRFSELWSSYASRDDMGKLQDPPSPVPANMVKLLQGEIDQLHVHPRPRPDLLSTVVTFRDEFAGVGFFSDSQHADASVVYKLLLAIGQPQRVMFLECHRCTGLDRGLSYRNYQYDSVRLVDVGNVPFLSKEDIMVVPEMKFRQMNVHAVGFPVHFPIFAQSLRQPSSLASSCPQQSRPRSSTTRDVLALLQLEFPWLTVDEIQEILDRKVTQAGGHSGGGQSSSSGSGGAVWENPK